MALRTIYDLTNAAQILYDMSIEDGDEQAFLDTLEGLKGNLEIKAADYVAVINQLTMEANEAQKVADLFTEKKEVRLRNIRRMKDALINAMDAYGVDTLKAGDYTLKIANNGGVQPMKITGEVPDSFTKVIVEPDNKKIRDALVNGEALEFAHLEERGRHLNIK